MTKYSIIVPIYNVSQYLRRCIESLKAQTYTDFEVILIDDCSTDDSYQICKQEAKSDHRFIVIRQEQNLRSSAARNLGLQKAKGEFVLFVDSDDYIENQMLANIDVVLSEYSYDLITWGMYNNIVKSNGDIIIEESPLNVKKDTYVKNPTNENWLMLWMDTFFASACNKLYKRYIINENSIIFDEVCVDFEDYLFNVKYCKCINSFVAISEPYYHYRQPEGQIPALKRQWKQVNPFEVSNLVFRVTSELIAQYSREENGLDDTMLYVYKAYMNELEYHYRTKRLTEYVRVVEVLSKDTSFAEMLAHIHQPALQKMVLPLQFFIRMNLGRTLALFLWLTEWKGFGRKGRIL